MQCTDVIRMDPPLALGVIMISTYPTTLETTRTPTLDAVVRTRNPQVTQMVTVVFLQGGLISLQRTSKYSMKQVIKKNTPSDDKYFVGPVTKSNRVLQKYSQKVVSLDYGKLTFLVILRVCVGL